MKTKTKEFIPYLYHEIEDEEKADEYIGNAVASIDTIVMFFNALESYLDEILCKHLTDRTDATGLIILSNMNYSSKMGLFKRFCDDAHIGLGNTIEGYDQLINDLKESGRLRNLVVHANWLSTDEEGYTYVRLKMSKKGMQQEYVQFSEESLEKITELVIQTKFNLCQYWEKRNDMLYGSN